MLPVYDPKSFASIDLRKYHIRTIQDIIKFNEFVESRMNEAQHVLKKFNTQFATMKGIATQMQKKQEDDAKEYGAPTPNPGMPEIQAVEEKNDAAEIIHQALVNEIRQAAAEETMVPADEEDPNERAMAEFEKYKVIAGKKGPMFYRNGDKGYKLVSKNDVPEDIKEQLLAIIEVKENGQ